MTNSTKPEPIQLTPQSRARLDAAALKILRSRYKYVRVREAAERREAVLCLIDLKTSKRVKDNDPAARRLARCENELINQLPKTFAELLPLVEINLGLMRGPLIGMLKDLKKRGLIEQVKGVWQVAGYIAAI